MATRTRTSGSIRRLSRSLRAGHRGAARRARSRRGAAYAANADGYRTALARWTREQAKIDTIPAAQRKLVTFHDAFPYFARHYGFELVGVILANAGQEPSARISPPSSTR